MVDHVVRRRGRLVRDRDVSGVSGTGHVADVTEFGVHWTTVLPDGQVLQMEPGWAVVRWLAGPHQSVVVWPSVDGAVDVHGHGGATRFVWESKEVGAGGV